jgi:hypothetical protein
MTPGQYRAQFGPISVRGERPPPLHLGQLEQFAHC